MLKKGEKPKRGLSAGGTIPYFQKYIFTDLSLMNCEPKDLECCLVVEGQHPSLLIFKDRPSYADSSVVRVDLIYVHDEELNVKKVRIRFGGVIYSRYRHMKQQKFQQLTKSLHDILYWCIDYQIEYQNYDKKKSNCRTFMIKLSQYLNVAFENTHLFEAQWYYMCNDIQSSH